MHDDLKAELLKQFPAEAIEIQDLTGNIVYACPKCKRPVSLSTGKCPMCGQTLAWNNILKKNQAGNGTRGRIEFDIPADFTQGDCRKCPLSYISKHEQESAYDCPLNMKSNCKLEIV